MKKIFISFVLTLMVVISGLCVNLTPVYATESEGTQLNIVALGDSISTGYGLANKETDLFLNKIKQSKNANLTNLAVDGYEAEDIVSLLNNLTTENTTAIENANTILITVGGNDILQPLLTALQNQLGKDISSATTNEISTAVMMLFLTQQQAVIQSIEQGVSDFESDFPTILTQLRQKNENAQIILQTVFNPAEKCTDQIFVTLYNFINPYIQAINEIIVDATLKNTYEYQVFDTYSAFKNNEGTELLTNIASFDIHPNILGNEVIYNGMITMINDIGGEGENSPTISSTVKIYTNGVYVNNPENEENTEEPASQQVAGGEVADLEKDANGYDIFKIAIDGTKDLVITENSGYKLTDVKLGETSVGAEKIITIKGDELPPTISIYFLEVFEITFSTDYNGYLMVNSEKLENPEVNKVEQVLYGSSINCSFIADYGYEVENLVIDNEEVEAEGANYTFSNVQNNHTFVVNFAKIEKTTYTNPTYNITLEASTESLPYGSTLNVIAFSSGSVYDEIINLIDPYSTRAIVYDFSIRKGNLTISPNGEFSISIKVSSQFKMSETKLYYVSSENEVEELSYTYDEDEGILTFKTDHCSYYVLLQKGEPVKSLWWIWLIVLCVIIIAAIIIVIVVFKKKKDEKIRKEIEEKNNNEYFSY